MLGKLLPILLALGGLGAGVGAGVALRPPPAAEENTHAEPGVCPPGAADPQALPPADGHGGEAGASGEAEFVKLNNQFVVPVVTDGRVGSLVVMSVTLEVVPGNTEAVYEREPKIRDAILQVLFDHANAGGFAGSFTDSTRMAVLRRALREVTRKILGDGVNDVLITDLVRQDA